MGEKALIVEDVVGEDGETVMLPKGSAVTIDYVHEDVHPLYQEHFVYFESEDGRYWWGLESIFDPRPEVADNA